MKKTIKLALVASIILSVTPAFATNGSTLIGVGAKARSMGGAGIGISHGAESALANPALINTVENAEFSFGGTIFMPDVSLTNTLINGTTPFSESADSSANLFVIPSVSIATKINDNFSCGIGMWGTGGMGVDYRDAKSITDGGTTMQMVTNVQVMQFAAPLAYTANGLSLAIAPILQYGAVDINYEYPGNPDPAAPAAGTNFGTGVGQDLKIGYTLGLSYEMYGVTLGAVYKSQIDMDYGNVLSSTISPFSATGAYTNEELSTPAEIGVGASYTTGVHTIAADYKMIQWEDAKGYQDFNWVNQSTIAVGYEYAATGWALRVGYNYSSSPIEDQEPVFGPLGETTPPNSAGISDGTANTFNLLGFPGIIESHVTLGTTFELNKITSIDLAYVMSLENSEKFTNFAGADIETTHSQRAFSFALNYSF